MSISEIYSSIRKVCEKVDKDNDSTCFSKASSQLEFILTNNMNLNKDFSESFVPAFEREIMRTKKSLEDAQRFKQFCNLYKNMTDSSFADKAMFNINMAIISAPIRDNNLLFQCFSQRSILHSNQNDYESSLKDLDHALEIRLSYTLIERKVDILNRLNRQSEAYRMLANIIQENEKILSIDKLKQFKKLKKQSRKFKSPFGIDDRQSSMDDSLDVTIDRRIKIAKIQCDRYDFQTNAEIAANTEILSEQPMIISFTADFLHDYCHNCHKKVTNTFWPCFNCTEVVFCTKKCAEHALHTFHQYECGLLSLMREKLGNQSTTVYRDFIQLPQLNLAIHRDEVSNLNKDSHQSIMKKILYSNHTLSQFQTFSFQSCLDQLEQTTKGLELEQARQWFFISQRELYQRIVRRKPLRRSVELCNAIILFMIYCYKMNVDMQQFERKDLIEIIEHFAISFVRTQLNEYSWQQKENQERQQVASFQCLFGSHINHECEPNAEWTFDGKKFVVKTIKNIAANESITITYGVPKDYSLLKRQRYLQNLYIMCACTKCLEETRNSYFAIRCEYCNGPIPYDVNEFVNDWCMMCERKYESSSIMSLVQKQFQILQRAIRLIGGITNQKTILENIEEMMGSLASYIYLESSLFIQMVTKLCDRYFELQMWSQAIEWYQWFVNVTNLHISYNKENEIIYYYNLKKWSNAYLNYLEQNVRTGKTNISIEYSQTAIYLFAEQRKLLESLQQMNRFEVIDSIQLKNMTRSLTQDLQCKDYRLRQVCLEILKTKNINDSMANGDELVKDLFAEKTEFDKFKPNMYNYAHELSASISLESLSLR